MNQASIGLSAPGRESARSILSLIHADGHAVTYRSLLMAWRKGMRNGNVSRLSVPERALMRCALWVARVKGSICNMRLMVQALSVVLRLIRNRRGRIVDAGNRRAQAMLEGYRNVFSWVPQLREWLRDPRYIAYLGILEVNG